jgi:single-stranded-DNA-specific exonuclease
MEKRWTRKEEVDQLKVKELSEALNDLPMVLCELLLQRGIDNFEKAKTFFRPSLDELHDPFLMKDMDLAVSRIESAIERGENILIYGDYDVDGTTSVALVYGFLQQYYPQLDFYIPDRYKEGYGISTIGIDYAADNNISLIIALDCGIKAIDKVAYAKEKGIDFIICDHHTPGEQIPQAFAVLDPKRKDCDYPYKELSGCGVGFKLMQALSIKRGIPAEALYQKLDILAVSICADIVPMTGENRILCHFGLQKLNEDPQPAFKAMLELAQVKKDKLNVTDVVFTLAPRINAAGRLESGMRAVELLLADHPEELVSKSKHIDNHNNDRRVLDKSITQEAISMIENDEALINRKTTVLYNENWHKGVIGIVASRCIESYYRPTIIITESNGKLAGSARSVKGFNVYDALAKCEDVLEQFGGHMYAAGMTLKKEQLKDFQDRFEEVVAASITEEHLSPEVEIDADLELTEINAKFYRVLEQFAPFGPENMRPQFCTEGVGARSSRIVGNGHVKVDIEDPENPGLFYPAIGFGLGDKMGIIKSGQPFDIVYSVELNEFRGKKSLQLNIKDIRKSEI